MVKKKISRRSFLKQTGKGVAGVAATSLAAGAFATPYIKNSKITDKVFVLGLDGMDPNLLRKFVHRGEMPAFQKLMQSGHFGELATTMPAQSPVAWSSFITGTNPGGNGIYDFIHRDPASFTPYLSTSRTVGATKTFDIGSWSIPIEGGHVELLRKGPAFWYFLEEHGIPATVYKIPANFPVEPLSTKMISGMGTPDLLGTYGTFTYFTDADVPGAENFTGGRVVKVRPVDHMVKSALEGPPNSLRTDGRNTKIDFKAYRDPHADTVKIEIQGHNLLMQKGEWSDWLPLKFEIIPSFSGVSGMVRIYVQEVHPYFKLYMSPINVDPMDSEIPISNPAHHSKTLSQAIGRFYTQGFPEDTKALSNGIFSNEEFLSQSRIVLEERLKAFDHELNNFDDGFFFFYVSSIDQNSHMMYRTMHPEHPLYEPDASPDVKDAVYFFYRAMDDLLRQTMDKMDSNSTLLVLSDHGFAPFSREFHLSTWLVQQGYTAVTDPAKMLESQYYDCVDWQNTKAFALGLNGLYINLRGRESNGSVGLREYEQLKKEIVTKLNQVRDPKTGQKIIRGAYDSRQIYYGPYLDIAPDIVIGYEGGYRISDEAVLGKFPQDTFGDRVDKWSADHCLEPTVVPGIFLSNREVIVDEPGIWDMAPTILASFGLPVPEEMDGQSVLG